MPRCCGIYRRRRFWCRCGCFAVGNSGQDVRTFIAWAGPVVALTLLQIYSLQSHASGYSITDTPGKTPASAPPGQQRPVIIANFRQAPPGSLSPALKPVPGSSPPRSLPAGSTLLDLCFSRPCPSPPREACTTRSKAEHCGSIHSLFLATQQDFQLFVKNPAGWRESKSLGNRKSLLVSQTRHTATLDLHPQTRTSP